jgi:hypothetical protein
MINEGRQPSCGCTSRMNREVHVRICERLGVKFPGHIEQMCSAVPRTAEQLLHPRKSSQSGQKPAVSNRSKISVGEVPPLGP